MWNIKKSLSEWSEAQSYLSDNPLPPTLDGPQGNVVCADNFTVRNLVPCDWNHSSCWTWLECDAFVRPICPATRWLNNNCTACHHLGHVGGSSLDDLHFIWGKVYSFHFISTYFLGVFQKLDTWNFLDLRTSFVNSVSICQKRKTRYLEEVDKYFPYHSVTANQIEFFTILTCFILIRYSYVKTDCCCTHHNNK
jgi:hypothetical protein